eukprot:COSAG03_NODE_447_length_7845_cov_823.248677_3_plen_169_part_00
MSSHDRHNIGRWRLTKVPAFRVALREASAAAPPRAQRHTNARPRTDRTADTITVKAPRAARKLGRVSWQGCRVLQSSRAEGSFIPIVWRINSPRGPGPRLLVLASGGVESPAFGARTTIILRLMLRWTKLPPAVPCCLDLCRILDSLSLRARGGRTSQCPRRHRADRL